MGMKCPHGGDSLKQHNIWEDPGRESTLSLLCLPALPSLPEKAAGLPSLTSGPIGRFTHYFPSEFKQKRTNGRAFLRLASAEQQGSCSDITTNPPGLHPSAGEGHPSASWGR